MSWLQRFHNTLFRGDSTRSRAEEEVQHHLDCLTEDFLARGHAEPEARRLARQQFGRPTQLQESTSDMDLLTSLEDWLSDLRLAFRRLLRQPLLLLSGVLLLTVGLGINTALFAVLHAMLFRPLPVPAAEQLVVIEEWRNQQLSNSNPARLADWQAGVTAFTAVAGSYGETLQLRTAAGNRSVQAMRLTGDWLAVLGVEPLAGRNFTPSELRGAPVALLTESGRSLGQIGDTLRLGNQVVTIIGLIPQQATLGSRVQVLLPMTPNLLNASRKAGFLSGLARLRPRVSLDAAQAATRAVAAQLAQRYPDTDAGLHIQLVPAQKSWAQEALEPAALLQAAALLLLALALLNLSAILAARSLASAAETQLRSWLGAGPWRVLRLPLLESACLIALGAAGALLAAPLALQFLQLEFGPDFPLLFTVNLDWRSFSFLLGAAVLSLLLLAALFVFGLPHRRSLQRPLVVGQAILGLLVLVGAYQYLFDFFTLQHFPFPPAASSLACTRVYLPWDIGGPNLQKAITELRRQLASTPGIGQVELADRLPLEGGSQDSPVYIQGLPEPTRDSIGIRTMSPQFFSLVGVPLLQGEWQKDQWSVLVNQSFARRYLSGNPLGRSLSTDGKQWFRITGVVADLPYAPNSTPTRPEVFFSPESQYWPLLSFVFATSIPPAQLDKQLRRTLSQVHPDLDYRGTVSLPTRMQEILGQPRRQLQLLLAFACLGIALLASGVYGTMAAEALARQREMAIRLALGCSRTRLFFYSIGRSLLLAATSIVLALPVLLLLPNSSHFRLPFLGAAASLLFVFAAAALLPATRSTRILPQQIMRQT